MIKVAADTAHSDLVDSVYKRHELLKGRIYSAESESDVRQGVLSLYDLDLIGNLEKHRIDYASEKLWIEFKYDTTLTDKKYRVKVISQVLHYMHKATMERMDFGLPAGFAIADKSYIMFYDTAKFTKYIVDNKYFWDLSPSAPHKELEDDLMCDTLITSKQFHVISDYTYVWEELNGRGLYETT